MKISKLFTNWFTKTGKEDKTTTSYTTNSYFDYKAEIHKRQDDERRRLEEWLKELDQIKMSTYNGNISSSSNIWNSIYVPDDTTISNHSEPTTLKVDGTIEVQGRDILKELDEMRDALLLLRRDVDMEAKYPRLRELKDEYERALEKYKTFDTLKESK